MDTLEKLTLLSDASQYDLACACGTTDQDRRKRGAGDMWLYPVSLPRGGYSIMLKTLLTNSCVNDCKYCPLRTGVDSKRCALEPAEVAKIFMDYVRRQKIHGLFLSSGVASGPDHTMDRMIEVASILRARYRYRGYIHLKVIPGASDAAIEKAVSLASAVSINAEAPTRRAFAKLTERKRFDEDVVRPMKRIAELTAPGEKYRRVKQTTQFIVGASDETDAELVTATRRLYDNLRLDRIYYSAYQKGLGDGSIPGEREQANPGDLLTREHRLYQVDFLFRQYKWSLDDIAFDDAGRLPLECDPKEWWARSHPERFPVRLNRADRDELLRVPGIGPLTARRILAARREGPIRELSEIGLKGKRLEQVRGYAICA